MGKKRDKESHVFSQFVHQLQQLRFELVANTNKSEFSFLCVRVGKQRLDQFVLAVLDDSFQGRVQSVIIFIDELFLQVKMSSDWLRPSKCLRFGNKQLLQNA